MKDEYAKNEMSNNNSDRENEKIKIKLTIQEIVKDFEKFIRYDERLVALFDFEKASEGDIEIFLEDMKRLTEKYLPRYKDNISEEYFSDDISSYDRALMLYNRLYENFNEIFFQLV